MTFPSIALCIHNDRDVANNDGIDLDHCKNVRVANCFIDTADDGIVIKNTPNFARFGRSENITVTGCVIASRSAALKIDEIYTTPVRNVVSLTAAPFTTATAACAFSHATSAISKMSCSRT